jgi:hypothetical protein
VVSGLSAGEAPAHHRRVTTYLIELYVPRDSFRASSGPAPRLRTIFVPSDEVAYCLVEAPSAAAAAGFAATLGLEPERIVEAVAHEPKETDDD